MGVRSNGQKSYDTSSAIFTMAIKFVTHHLLHPEKMSIPLTDTFLAGRRTPGATAFADATGSHQLKRQHPLPNRSRLQLWRKEELGISEMRLLPIRRKLHRG